MRERGSCVKDEASLTHLLFLLFLELLKSPLDSKEIKPVNPKGNQP